MNENWGQHYIALQIIIYHVLKTFFFFHNSCLWPGTPRCLDPGKKCLLGLVTWKTDVKGSEHLLDILAWVCLVCILKRTWIVPILPTYPSILRKISFFAHNLFLSSITTNSFFTYNVNYVFLFFHKSKFYWFYAWYLLSWTFLFNR